jgi:hypothetical protein
LCFTNPKFAIRRREGQQESRKKGTFKGIGFDEIWDDLQQRFAGFDYKPIIQGGTDDAKHLCWERPQITSHGT